MFDPDGYLPVPHVVAWIAGLGREGKLDRGLGFVHPGETADALDLPAEATARCVLGEKLAGGALTAQMILDPSGVRLPVPAFYWSGRGAVGTMETGWLDFSALGLQNDLQIAHVVLAIDAVAVALGFRFASEDDPAATTTVDPYARTGAPGRPSGMHLVCSEHMRRLESGKALTMVSNEARHLAAWFRRAHPLSQPPTAKTIENVIRPTHRQRRTDPPK